MAREGCGPKSEDGKVAEPIEYRVAGTGWVETHAGDDLGISSGWEKRVAGGDMTKRRVCEVHKSRRYSRGAGLEERQADQRVMNRPSRCNTTRKAAGEPLVSGLCASVLVCGVSGPLLS